MEPQLNASEATSLAHNTLSSQITALLSITSGSAKAQIESLQSMLNSNMGVIIEAANNQIDENNSLIDLLEARDKEIDELKISLSRSQADVRQMISARRDDESKVKSIEDKYKQVIRQRDNYQADSKELGSLRAEVKRLKNQVERNKETAEKETSKSSRLEAQLSSLRSKMLPTHEAVIGCVDLMRYVRNALLFEGLSAEESLDIKGRTFHIYRRPGNIKDAYHSSDNVDDVSRDHMYYFRVETHDGVHFDVMPLASGEVAVTSLVKGVPAELKKYIKSLFEQETLYDADKIVMRSDALTKRLDEITKTLPALEALKSGMTHQLITNKVITASRVNTNKQKRRAA
jgi:myosin heavy subunit